MSKSLREMQAEVDRFQLEVLGGEQSPQGPLALSGDAKRHRLNFLHEEVAEFDRAETLEDQADALIDLVYFALGALHHMGVPAGPVWDEVHARNMQKRLGTVAKRALPGMKDAVKPEGWTAPDHSWLNEVTPAIVAACRICAKKAGDYQRAVKRDDYFPFGLKSYVHEIFKKALRLKSLAAVEGDPLNESVMDTALDTINYCRFLADRLAAGDLEG